MVNNNETIFVTGAAGLLGANFSRYLLSKGYKVIGIDNLSGGYEDFLPQHKNFEFIKLNLEDKESLKIIFTNKKPSTVFHFAAYAAEGLSPFIRNFNYTNNVIASVNVINECINHNCKIIFTSSIAVYGSQEPPFSEDQPLMPIDPYGIAKMTVEQDIKQAHNQFGLRYNIVRPHNVIGIYQNIWDRYRNAIGIFIRKVLDGEDIVVYGDGEQTRAFSDIQYYMEPFLKLISGHDGETFNIGADKYFTINEMAQKIKDLNPSGPSNIVYGDKRHEAVHAYCSHDKAKNILDFKDDTNIDTLINQMYKWAAQQKPRGIKNMEYEVTKNMYTEWKH